jgi:hypothetical protein
MRFVFYDNSNIAPNTDVPPTLLLSPFDWSNKKISFYGER